MESQQPLIQLPLDHLGHPLTSAGPQGDYSQQLVHNTAAANHHNNNSLNNNGNNTANAVAATAAANDDDKVRRPRSKWTQEETDDLIKGCATHGVGNWKKYVSSL
jgi:hypothetical protein